jgi:hypothetical protein
MIPARPCAPVNFMATTEPRPKKPLKILTIGESQLIKDFDEDVLNEFLADGYGLQGISTLLILDKLIDSIAKRNNTSRPRPCDIFDVITGIGTGG